jgi:hypothetical protein
VYVESDTFLLGVGSLEVPMGVYWVFFAKVGGVLAWVCIGRVVVLGDQWRFEWESKQLRRFSESTLQ